MRRFPVALCLALLVAASEGEPLRSGAVPAPVSAKQAPAPEKEPAAAPAVLPTERHLDRSSFGKPLQLPPGVVHVYEFPLRQGEFLRLRVDQVGLDVTTTVLDPSGRTALVVDALNGKDGPEDVPVLAARAGVHRIRIEPGEATPEGTYRLAMLAQHRTTASDRLRWQAAESLWRGRNKDLPGKRRADLLAEAVNRWKELGSKQGQADALIDLGYLWYSYRKWQAASESLAAALPLYVELGNGLQQRALLNELGLAQKELFDFAGACRSYQAALVFARQAGEEAKTATILVNLGLSWLAQGEFARADRAFEEARSIRDRSGTRAERAAVLNALGRSRCAQGDCQQALELHRLALQLLDPKRDTGEIAATYLHLGDTFDALGDRGHAESYCLRARYTWHKLAQPSLEAVALNNLTMVYKRAGETRRALEVERQVLRLYQALGEDDNTVIAWFNVGLLYTDLRQPARARTAFDATAALLARGGPRQPLRAAYHLGLARLARLNGRWGTALEEIQRAIVVVEEIRGRIERNWQRMTYTAGSQAYYTFQIELLMERHRREPAKGWDRQAFEVSERSRARALLENLAQSGAPSSVAVEEVQGRLLDDDSALLEYSFGEGESFLWVVTRRSFASYRLAKKSDLAPLLEDVVARLQRSRHEEELPETYTRAKRLGQVLLGPLGRLPREARLVLAAPAEMQSLPLSALPDPFSKQEPTAENPWPHPLLETKEVVSEPSMAFLAALRADPRQKSIGAPSLALVAVPQVAPEGRAAPPPDSRSLEGADGAPQPLPGRFPTLRFWRKEVDAIRGEASGLSMRVFLGVEAQAESVEHGQLEAFRILHFITHGYLDEAHPEHSALVLSAVDAKGAPRDPYLTAEDVEKLRLPADLVVLDGCRTGLGRTVSGEGAVGLSHAFLKAGASRLIVTLFDVYDPDAPAFMAAFYHGLFAEKRRVGDALRQAKLATWRQPGRAAPANWAGFVHLGDWR